MRILIRTELYSPSIGGVQSHVYLLAKGLARRGHEVRVLTSLQDSLHPHSEERDGVLITRTPGFGAGNAGLAFGILTGVPAFRRYAPRYDVWHTHVVYAAVPALLCRTVGIHRPHVLTMHNSRFLHLARHRMLDWPHRLLVNSADHVLAPSEALAEVAARFCRRAPVTVMIPGVDTERFKPTLPMLRPNRLGQIVVCACRLERSNAVDVLLAAWPRVYSAVNATLYICGAGGEQEALERQARALGLGDEVRFYGAVEHFMMPAVFSSADLVVVPSRGETASLTALEAMACERAVVATAVGSQTSIVDASVGRLVPPDNPRTLADAIVELLRAGAQERHQLGVRGRERVVAHWSMDAFVERHLAIYESLLAQRKRR